MSDDFDAELQSLLQDAKALQAPSDDVKARVRMRLAMSLPPTPGGAPARAETPSVTPTLPHVPIWTLAAALVLGAVGGYALAPKVKTEVQTVYVDRPAITTPTREPLAQETSASTVGVHPEDLPKAIATHEGVLQDLSKEREVLDIAKAALGRSDAAASLQKLGEHARLYPHGALSEEREALAVQALVSLGRKSEAEARAQRFATSYPKSVLLPAVRASIGEP